MRGCGHPQEHKRSKLFLARAPRRGCVQPPISHFTRQVQGQEYALHPDTPPWPAERFMLGHKLYKAFKCHLHSTACMAYI